MNDRYLQYELEDFLTDDSFVNWVLDGSNNIEWQAWLEKNKSKTTDVKTAKNLVGQLKFQESKINPGIKQNLWDRIYESTQAKEVTFPNKRRWIYGLSVAASIVLLAIFMLRDTSVVYTTPPSMTETIILPATSKVTLASSSKVSYKSKSWEKKRNINLSGKGHFEVSKGVPFTVNTDNGSVKVLGTEFDVVSIEDAFQVLVTEGRVSVSSGNHKKILTAGMAFYKNPLWEGEHRLSIDWKVEDMYFVYRDEPLSDVLKAIEYQYSLKIDSTSVDTSTPYTGYFDTNDDLATSLERILWVLNIEFEIINDQLILSPK